MTDSPWLRRAIAIAAENAASGAGGPFGAVITRGGKLIAEGVNRVTTACDPTAHAEVNAIRQAAAALKTHDLSGCEIYASCEPCPMCLGAILWARLDRVWYAATQQQAAAAGFDDSNFYTQIGLPPDQRSIPMTLVPGSDSDEPFLAWQRFSAKVPY